MTDNRQPQAQGYRRAPNFAATLILCGDRWQRWYILTSVGPSHRYGLSLAADVPLTGALLERP